MLIMFISIFEQELAKSTLLRALQRERNNVDELEATLSTLQQNNSAISGMVESRDMLINELNDRVAVFEEDKVVLKAALRQLQKEMKEEAPKTQKLIHDLQLANEGKIRLYPSLVARYACIYTYKHMHLSLQRNQSFE